MIRTILKHGRSIDYVANKIRSEEDWVIIYLDDKPIAMLPRENIELIEFINEAVTKITDHSIESQVRKQIKDHP